MKNISRLGRAIRVGLKDFKNNQSGENDTYKLYCKYHKEQQKKIYENEEFKVDWGVFWTSFTISSFVAFIAFPRS